MIFAGLLLAAFIMSWLLTGMLRRYALSKNILDVPNERSSHFLPTPRGGGLAIVLSFLFSLLFLSSIDELEYSLLMGLLGGGILVSVIGFIDDHRHIAARWRLLVHIISAGWILYWFGGFPPLLVFGNILDLGIWGNFLAILYLVWFLNLYNFMDGIDGIASIEAITVSLSGAVLYWLIETDGVMWVMPSILTGAVAGFLFWNFPRAKIFMGDVGSGFLGITLGALSIQAGWLAPELFWAWLILLGVFFVDATVTLIRRIIRGEQFYKAHRSHAYQRSARRWGHKQVTLVVLLINILWLFPLAYMSILYPFLAPVILLAAFTPLFIMAIKLGAGWVENAES